MASDEPPMPPIATLAAFAHALGAPLCALEVVLAAQHHLPAAQAGLLQAAVERLRRVLDQAAAQIDRK